MMKHATIHIGLAAFLLASGIGAAMADDSHARTAREKNDAIAAQNDRAYAKYRCVVLGDEAACRPKKSLSVPS